MCAIFRELLWSFHFTTRTTIALHLDGLRRIEFFMTLAYDIATAAVTGLMAGNELAVAAFAHPQLHRLDKSAHVQIAPLLARVLGRVMPLWYGLALVLILGAAYEHRPFSSGPGLFLSLAAALWALIIVFTVTMLVPINNRIAKLNPDQPYDCWLQDRCRWDQLHQVRVILLIMAFLLLLTGLFGSSAASIT